MPHLQLGGLDEHRFFSARELSRASSYGTGEDVLWLLGTLARLVALAVLVRRAPRFARGLGLGPIGSAVIVGMVLLVTIWFVGLPFGLAELWWQHHWGLGPFDPAAWLLAQDVSLPASAVFAMFAILIPVGLAVRLGRLWWLAGVPVFIAIAVCFGFSRAGSPHQERIPFGARRCAGASTASSAPSTCVRPCASSRCTG